MGPDDGSTPPPPRGSTTAGVRGPAPVARTHRARAAATALLAAVVVAGAAGLLGVRSATAVGSAAGYRVEVEHAAVARAGLDAPFEVRVHRDGGFEAPLVVALRSSYFDIYEEQGLSPQPAEETSDAEWDYLTLTPPPGEDLVLSFDAYVQPASQVGASGEVRVLEGGRAVVAVPFRTWLLP